MTALASPAAADISVERVLRALDRVIDPELDEPITSLRFVSSVRVGPARDVEVVLRLPTPQCAPNFAFLMAADARNAISELPGIGEVTVTLHDHYTAAQINSALDHGAGFTGAFPGETDDDTLDSLRELFRRKALIARQARVCRELMAAGAEAGALARARVRDLPDTAEAQRCCELRSELGIGAEPDAPALVAANGEPLQADQLERWLRMASLVATSLEANGGICRSLLAARYDIENESEEARR
jgi:metal-sulfur cluster biosynthetic enzyme